MKPWLAPSTRRIRRRTCTSAGCSCTRRGWPRPSGLSDSEIQGVKTAALLHDIGKLAVPEHILSKPGPLTQEEFQKIRIHPQVGAEIIAKVPFPYPVAPLIMSHHERWDGKGYPQGLAGEQIPIGARILTIVDYYDAVTTERPYHTALTMESAIGLLRHEIGRALDPKLVPLFVELLPALVAEAGEDAHQEVAPAPHTQAASAGVRPAAAPGTSAFENIALAHREIYALYEIAQSMGTCLSVSDTMALISSKISKVVPWSGCSLFLHQPETGLLKCRFAVGIEASQSAELHPERRPRHCRSGRAPPQTIIADPGVVLEALGPEVSSRAQVGHRLSADLQRHLHRMPEPLSLGAELLLRGSPPAARAHRGAGGRGIHNSIVFEQTQEDSLTDPLTGLPNRRSMFVHMSRELARAERLKHELAVIVMDVDDFKAINDTYGHNIGDQALREVAGALQGALRPYDLCVRYAGDEFIVVLADCSRELVDAKRRELQSRVADIGLEVRAGETTAARRQRRRGRVPQDGTTFEALLADADHRMYRDKAVRRGQLTMLSRRARRVCRR